eukprot:6463849-Amphidinium_carterae.1
MPTVAVAWSDADFAGCLLTRRSTSGVALTMGDHCIHTSSTTQIPVSLSSGESEYYAAVKAGSRLLGLLALLGDLGHRLKGKLMTDSSAAKGVASRRGCGKIRHLEIPAL